MSKRNAIAALLITVIILVAMISSCSNADKTEPTSSPAEIPDVQASAIIRNNTFTSDSLGIEMKLPGEWYINYKTIPDDVLHFSLLADFDSTVPINGSTPKLIFDNDIISFMIENHDVSNANLQFIATKDEYDEISINQVIINIKEGFAEKDEIVFEDLPDLNLDGLIIKRFKVTREGYSPTMHVTLNDGYTILINCNYKYEVDYLKMENIISTIKMIND